ncbi:hypothetical protein F4806DRAFT_121300 [Annulohypoxylon nitens]|nr:hypothetical protein F4806DRAFT_121300 [Annulohypoxylon nitens]
MAHLGRFPGLCMISLMASIDSTIITSLPTATWKAGGAGQFSLQSLFSLGDSIADGSHNVDTLIACRLRPLDVSSIDCCASHGVLPLYSQLAKGNTPLVAIIGTWLFSILREDSIWVGFQVIALGEIGIVFTATLLLTLAAFPESTITVAAGTYSFVHSPSPVWGATMAVIALNGRVDAHPNIITEPEIRRLLTGNDAYLGTHPPAIISCCQIQLGALSSRSH